VSLIQIEVALDEQTNQLTPDLLEINLDLHDEVHWIFPSTSHIPHIHFPAGDSHNNRQFGPFQYIERSSGGLVALGNTGFAGSYPYILTLLDEDGPVFTSAEVVITNLASTPDTSPEAVIQYQPPVVQGLPPTLLVTPNPLSLEVGRTATWRIKGIPAGHFVTFRFDDVHPATGPFASLSLSRGVGDCWRANATDFLFDLAPLIPLPAQISYHVALRNAQGQVLVSHDPVIEPLGPPISSSME
jgi:hypothetical protein